MRLNTAFRVVAGKRKAARVATKNLVVPPQTSTWQHPPMPIPSRGTAPVPRDEEQRFTSGNQGDAHSFLSFGFHACFILFIISTDGTRENWTKERRLQTMHQRTRLLNPSTFPGATSIIIPSTQEPHKLFQTLYCRIVCIVTRMNSSYSSFNSLFFTTR